MPLETDEKRGMGIGGWGMGRRISDPQPPAPIPLFRRLAAAIRTVFGMPDYDRYVTHREARHRGEPLLSPSDYYAQHLKRRYESGGPTRCC